MTFKILLLSLCLINNSYALTPTVIHADYISASNRVGGFGISPIAITPSTVAVFDSYGNLISSSTLPISPLSFTGPLVNSSGIVAINGDVLDSNLAFANAFDPTKRLVVDLSEQASGAVMTIAPQNVINTRVHIPQPIGDLGVPAPIGRLLIQDEVSGYILGAGISAPIGNGDSMFQLANATEANRAQIKLHSYFNGDSVAGVSTLTSRSGVIPINESININQDYSKWTAQAAAGTPGSAPISGSWAFQSAGVINSLTVPTNFHIDTTNLAGVLGRKLTINSEGILTLPGYGAGVMQTDASGVVSSSPLTLPNSGVVAGSYTNTNFTVDASGIITAASNGAAAGSITLTPVGSSPNADGASLAGSALTLQPASVTYPGLILAIPQTMSGDKLFTDNTMLSGAPSANYTAFGVAGTVDVAINNATVLDNIFGVKAGVSISGSDAAAGTGSSSASFYSSGAINSANGQLLSLQEIFLSGVSTSGTGGIDAAYGIFMNGLSTFDSSVVTKYADIFVGDDLLTSSTLPTNYYGLYITDSGGGGFKTNFLGGHTQFAAGVSVNQAVADAYVLSVIGAVNLNGTVKLPTLSPSLPVYTDASNNLVSGPAPSGTILVLTSSPGGAGYADFTMLVPDLRTSDVILAVTAKKKGDTTGLTAHSLIGWDTQAAGSIYVHYSGDPGGNNVVLVAIKR